MKIAVTGAKGRLGSLLISPQYEYYPIDIHYDGDDTAVRSAVNQVKPDVIIHCAGFTDVDDAELHPDIANRDNGLFAVALRESFDGRLIYLSTDYIFGGHNGPYKEDDTPAPCCAYGRSKLLGEHLLEEYEGMDTVIVRTTVLYGSPTCNKPDFVTGILAKLHQYKEISVPTKIIGSPTYVPHLAEALNVLARLSEHVPPVINISGSDVVSRFDFAQTICDVFGLDANRITPCDYGYGIANRPKRVGLVVTRAKEMGLPIYSVARGLVDMRRWLDGR